PILTDTDTTGTILKTSGSDYIEFNSIQLKKGETSLNITGDYNFVKYCYFEGAHYAIRMDDGAGDPDITSPYIGYSYFEGAGAGSGDGIHSRYGTTYMTVEYCEFDEWSHGAITSNYHTSNGLVSGTPNTTVHDTIRYNYIKNTSDMDSEAIIVAGNGIEVYHNWAEDAGNIHITMGSNIKVHHNVINNTASGLTSHSAINIQDVWEHDMTDIDVYNNVVYFDGTQGTLMDGIRIFDGHTGSIMERINIRNNVVLNCNRYSFDVVEYAAANEIESNCNDTDCNKFNNNIAYGWTGSYYARVEGSTFTTAALFNDGVDGTYNATPGNLETDPSFKDPANDKFYPESNTDPVIDAGYNVGASYDDYLTKHSDFSGSPPYVSTQ
nr:hypothetical protein [Phycisphaerae bacterium]NIR67078.1 hypothetical protein [candidate division Zixibacteria bacterium]NIT61021.1 hypothetical protein [Fodinibius sp.]NIS51298.1 hypothetical protein [Phycisphaerae bacterium]NIU16596.1 hypothetical protein [candidate division Zixibacteria bacterium]